jgi:hypothetical protein
MSLFSKSSCAFAIDLGLDNLSKLFSRAAQGPILAIRRTIHVNWVPCRAFRRINSDCWTEGCSRQVSPKPPAQPFSNVLCFRWNRGWMTRYPENVSQLSCSLAQQALKGPNDRPSPWPLPDGSQTRRPLWALSTALSIPISKRSVPIKVLRADVITNPERGGGERRADAYVLPLSAGRVEPGSFATNSHR